MTRWESLFSRRWLGYLAFAVAFAIACGFLSSWQLNRGNEAAAANRLIEANFHAPPVPLAEALPSLDAFDADQQWLRVTVTGTYLPHEELLVRNRPTASGPGFEVLTPLRLADGTVFVVDRGWVPTGEKQDAPDSVPAPPVGEVTVIARLKPSEPHLGTRTASGRQVATIELPVVKRRIGGDVYTGAYGVLDTQSPAPASVPTPVFTSEPTQDEGLHWSYMIQWIIFALIAFFGLGYAVRQELRMRALDAQDGDAGTPQPARTAKRTDADIEDEILDAAR
ncbi:MAG: SURF1 family protein [Terrimesophilobacter sp.]